MSLSPLFFSPPNRRTINPNAFPDGLWWLRGATCLAMRALGELFGGVGSSSGAKMGAEGGSRGLKKKFWKFGVPPKPPKSAKRGPKRPPRAPKTRPREPQNIRKSIFRSPNLIFLKSSSRRSEIKVFQGGRVRVGARNRHREAPR